MTRAKPLKPLRRKASPAFRCDPGGQIALPFTDSAMQCTTDEMTNEWQRQQRHNSPCCEEKTEPLRYVNYAHCCRPMRWMVRTANLAPNRLISGKRHVD